MNLVVIALSTLLLLAQSTDTTKVESTFDKKTDFAAVHTYSWAPGYNAYRPDVHKAIVDAIDAEMASLGLKKVPSAGDVTIAYYAVASTEVDFKALEKLQREGRSEQASTKTLGRLVVMMRKPGVEERVWSASTREFVDADPAKLDTTLRSVAGRLFATYPTRLAKSRG
jgi:hypothetical protein